MNLESKTIFRVKKDRSNPYVMMDKRPIENRALSFKAKGILSYLLSRPDDWEINLADLINRSSEGISAIRSGLKELKEVGHIRYVKIRNDKGQIEDNQIWAYEKPFEWENDRNAENLSSGDRDAGFQDSGESLISDNQTQLIKESLTDKDKNTKKDSGKFTFKRVWSENLIEHFCDLSEIMLPDWKLAPKGTAKLWNDPLKFILTQVVAARLHKEYPGTAQRATTDSVTDFDIEITKSLIELTIKYQLGRKLDIYTPKSLNTLFNKVFSLYCKSFDLSYVERELTIASMPNKVAQTNANMDSLRKKYSLLEVGDNGND